MLRRAWTTLLAASLALSPATASAFQIFGVTLFGKEDSNKIEILDPVEYKVNFNVAGDDSLEKPLKQSSGLWTGRNEPAAGSAGLISSAQGDYRSLLATLYTEARYSGAISIKLNGREAASIPLTEDLAAPVRVDISVDPGPSFRFGRADFVNPPPRVERDPRVVGKTTLERYSRGEPARADVVTAAGDTAVTAWRRVGHPKARVADRSVVAEHATRKLDVTIRLDPGPEARFGQVTIDTPGKVDRDFVRYMADIPEGERFDPDVIDKTVERLNDLRVFRAVRVVEAEQVSPDGSLPLTVEALPRLPHRFGFGAEYSTTEGLGLSGFWLHRNLFGRAERLRFDASVSGIAETSDPSNYDYSFGVGFTKPGVISPTTRLETGLTLSQNVYDTYKEQRAEVRLGLVRQFTDNLTGSVFSEISYSDVSDDTGNREFLTFGFPVTVEYDKRNSELDPSHGYYLSAETQPFYEAEYQTTAVRNVVEGRAYLGFAEGRTVLAFRGRYGTVLGGNLDEIPPDLLFFTGGGGSVRGYPYRSNGIEVDGDTVGGRSSVEVSAELRQKFTDRFGMAIFADGGMVSRNAFPDGDTDLKVGAGIGGRLYTGIGPIRLDVATPIDREKGDQVVAFYIGIGQAF